VYAPASAERFDAMIYGPLYYWVGARVIDPEKITYRPVRALSLLALLACVAGVSLLAFRLTHSQLAAVLAGLLLLSYGFVSLKGLSARSDIVALALVFWGFIVAHQYRETRGILLAVPLIVLGLFFKQQYVAAPLAICFYLALERRRRLAVEFAGLTVISGAGLLAYFQYVVYPGQSLLLHLVEYNMIAFTWNRFGWGMAIFLFLFGVPTLLGLEFLRRRPDRLLSTYLGFAVLVAVFALAKEGSGTNYYLEPLLVLCAPVAALAAECRTQADRRVEVFCLLAVSLLAGTRLASFPPSARDFVVDRAVQDYLRSNFSPGTPAGGTAVGQIMRAGLETPISDFYQYTWLACAGRIPQEQVLAHFERRRFGLVALGLNLQDEEHAHHANEICLTEDLHRAILLNYRLEATLELPRPEQADYPTRLYLWVPRGADGSDKTQTKRN
jgi:hypothetical protein